MNTVIRKIGNSEGVILPKDLLAKLNMKTGDRLTIVEHEKGLQLVPETASLSEQLEAARIGMNKYRIALRELAK